MVTERFVAGGENDEGILLAGRLIRQGEIVAFPTETVYGLGADGLNAAAVHKIFEAKGRPSDNPLILHVADKKDVSNLWSDVTPLAKTLMDAFWPGPLTLVYHKAPCVPDAVTAGLDTVAVRMPDHKTALSVIRAAETPIAAPSANLSGKPSPTTADHVAEDLDGKIPLIIDGGPCRVGVESTVLSITGIPTILRPGVITKEMLQALVGEVRLSDALLSPLKDGEVPASPGMAHQHYAPDCQVVVVRGNLKDTVQRIRQEYQQAEALGKTCAVLATEQTKESYEGMNHYVIGDRNYPETLCQNLFFVLRDLSSKVDILFAEGVSPDQEGLAFMNRLLRAAGFVTIDV